MQEGSIHICDDWLSCTMTNLETVHIASISILRSHFWKEVVAGIDSLAVQFDPAETEPADAVAKFRDQLSNLNHHSSNLLPPVTVPICYDPEFGPDLPWIAEKLGMSKDECAAYHSRLTFKVTILGFMPGFAYMQTETEIENIGRLDNPRQSVSAGSIGFIGRQNCIYSFESPGGWPIIGRTPVAIFDLDSNPPNTLSAGQEISFKAIDRSEYEILSKASAP